MRHVISAFRGMTGGSAKAFLLALVAVVAGGGAAFAQAAGDAMIGAPVPWGIGLQPSGGPIKDAISSFNSLVFWIIVAITIFVFLLLVYVAILTVIYRHGPCRQKARLRWLTPGAVFAALLSLALSLIFSWYLQTFVRTAYYGPLAAMMGFLLWTWLTVQIVLMGAELNAEIEHQTAVDTTTGPPLAIGERGAVVADTVGPKRGSPAALAFTLKYAEALSDRLLRRRIRKG